MRWIQVRRRTWSDANTRAYRQGGYDGVIYEPSGDPAGMGVDFVAELDGLRGARFAGDVGDDTAVFAVDGVEELILESRARQRLALQGLRDLRSLTTLWRPGIETAAGLPLLRSLTVDHPRIDGLRFFAGFPALRELRLSLKRTHEFAAAGPADESDLDSFWVEGGIVSATDEISLPSSVTQVVFDGTRGVDLGFVRRLPALTHLRLENCGEIPSLVPLAEHPALRTLTIHNTAIGDGDTSPLIGIPDLYYLGLSPRGAASHTHRAIADARRTAGLAELAPR